MFIERMADHSKPLSERVQAALLCWDMDDAHEAARAALLADVAAADRLARAAIVVADYKGMRMELTRRIDIGDTTSLVYDADAWYQAGEEYKTALNAYRARMQGVARG